MIKSILVILILVFSPLAFSHGGGGSRPAGGSDNHQESPLRMALDSYREGQEYLDSARSIEQKAERTTKAKKQAKLHNKANKQFKKAAKKFTNAIKYESLLYQAHAGLGVVQNHFGEYQAALTSYGNALRQKPRNAQVIADRAHTFLAVGRLRDGQLAYKQLMKLDRAKADELMADMRRWTQSPPDNGLELKNEELLAFGQWVEAQ